jgi:hypothetical protein
MKVHLAVRSYPWVVDPASICGMAPRHGHYDIRTTSTFFHVPEKDQCTRCVKLFRDRGNNIEQLRADAKFGPQISGKDVIADRQVCHV